MCGSGVRQVDAGYLNFRIARHPGAIRTLVNANDLHCRGSLKTSVACRAAVQITALVAAPHANYPGKRARPCLAASTQHRYGSICSNVPLRVG